MACAVSAATLGVVTGSSPLLRSTMAFAFAECQNHIAHVDPAKLQHLDYLQPAEHSSPHLVLPSRHRSALSAIRAKPAPPRGLSHHSGGCGLRGVRGKHLRVQRRSAVTLVKRRKDGRPRISSATAKGSAATLCFGALRPKSWTAWNTTRPYVDRGVSMKTRAATPGAA